MVVNRREMKTLQTLTIFGQEKLANAFKFRKALGFNLEAFNYLYVCVITKLFKKYNS